MISFFPPCQRSCCDGTAITDQLLDMCSLNKPAFKSHAEAMSVSHAKRHPHCGCTAANAVHVYCPSCLLRHACTKDGHFCVQGFSQTILELDLSDVDL